MKVEAKEAKIAAARAVVLKIKDACEAPFIARDAVEKLTGGMINPRTLSNHDCAGSGPEGMFYIGRRAAYPTDSFCEWLLSRVSLEPEQRGGRKA